MSLMPNSHYWFVERDQIGIGYWSEGVWTSPSTAVTLRIYGVGYPDVLAAEDDEFNFPEEFHQAPLYYALKEYALLKGDTAKYQMFKIEFADEVKRGRRYAADNRTDQSARGFAQGINGTGY